MNLTNETIKIIIIRIVRTFLAIITLPLTAIYFGTSQERDAWVLATTILTVIGMTTWGAINETFRAKFVLIREELGDEVAFSKSLSLVGITIIMSIFIVVFIIIFINPITEFIIQDNNREKQRTLMWLTLMLLPTLILNQMSSMGISVLNAYDKFLFPEIIGIISSLFNILAIWMMGEVIGIYSLVISQYFSILILFGGVVVYLNQKNLLKLQKIGMNWQDANSFLKFAFPLYLPYVAGQISLIIEKILANSMGVGSVSILEYSRQFAMMLQAVIGGVLFSIMVPVLAKSFANNNKKQFIKKHDEIVSAVFLVLCLAVPIMVGAAKPLTVFLFDHGNIPHTDIHLIGQLLMLYGAASIAVFLYMSYGVILISGNQGKYYGKLGVAAQLLVLTINICFVKQIELYTFPISFGLAHLITAVALLYKIRKDMKLEIHMVYIKYIIYIIILSAMVYLINLKPIFYNSFLQLILSGIFLLGVIVLIRIIPKFKNNL